MATESEQYQLFNKMEDEYRSLMNYVQTDFITSYKQVNLTITNLTNKMKGIMCNITKMTGLFVKCPNIISSNILGLDLNTKLEALSNESKCIIEEYNRIVNFAEEKNASLILQSHTINTNIQSTIKEYNGLNFIDISKQLQNFVDTNTKNRDILEKYISDLDGCGKTINQITKEVEKIIAIPLSINNNLQNVATEVLTQYSTLVGMQMRESSSKSL